MKQTRDSLEALFGAEIPDSMRETIKALPPLYHDPPRYELLAQLTAPADIDFYQSLLRETGGPVLELGCGTGRLLLELARGGAEVVGLDLSPALLDFARQKADAQGAEITLALGDMRRFDIGRTFPLLIVAYNSFNHLFDLDSICDCLLTLAKHMDADSRLVIDTFQPSLAFLGDRPDQRRAILHYLDPQTGERVILHEENHYDPVTQVNRVIWSYEIDGKQDARVEELRMRLFFPQEFDALLTLNGFEIEEKYGNYDRQPFGPDTPKQLTVCRLVT
jgi:SAM-dependent methyltransferase